MTLRSRFPDGDSWEMFLKIDYMHCRPGVEEGPDGDEIGVVQLRELRQGDLAFGYLVHNLIDLLAR